MFMCVINGEERRRKMELFYGLQQHLFEIQEPPPG